MENELQTGGAKGHRPDRGPLALTIPPPSTDELVGKCCLFSCDWAVVGGMGFMRVWVVNHTSNKVYQFLAFGAGDNIICISPRLHISTLP